MAEAPVENPLWEFSLAAYRDRVAALCLRAQDECDADVNLLLYAAWLAREDRLLTSEHLADQQSAVHQWRERVVQPLRRLRVELRDYVPARAIREGLADLELQAERTQQAALYAGFLAAGAQPYAPQPLTENLARAAAAGGSAEVRWRALVEELAMRLSAQDGGFDGGSAPR
ncbi:MAG: TIGR02444 family protein [Halioglobus sp.]